MAIIIEIWAYRNKVIFTNGVVDSVEIFFLAQIKGLYWLKEFNLRILIGF